MSTDGLQRWILLLAVFGASALAFAPSLGAGFVWDDSLVVTGNYDFRGLDASRLHWMATTSRAGHYQPLTWLSLALDFERSAGPTGAALEAAPFHATNVALHALFAVVLYLLAFALLRRALPDASAASVWLAAAFAALFHAVHPLRCESVCWVTERRDVLSGLFFALATLAYCRGAPSADEARWRAGPLLGSVLAAGLALAALRLSVSLEDPAALGLGALGLGALGGAGLALAAALLATAIVLGAAASRPERDVRFAWRVVASCCVALSLFAKAWAMVIPVLWLLLDLYPLSRGRRGAREVARLVAEKAPIVALAAAFAWLASWAQRAQQGTMDLWQAHTFSDRIAQAAWGLLYYPAKTLVPVGLVPLREIPDDLAITQPRYLAAFAVAAAITFAALASLRRRPALAVPWLAYVVVVSPVLGLAQAGPQLVADRYGYLACVPFALLLAGALLQLARASRAYARFATVFAGLWLAVLMAAAFHQSRIWQSDEVLWEFAVAAGEPPARQAILNLGVVRMDAARYAEAEALFREGMERSPEDPTFALALGVAKLRTARAAAPDGRGPLLDAAAMQIERAIALFEARGLRRVEPYVQHGIVLRERGELEGSRARLAQAVEMAPTSPDAHLELVATLVARAERDAVPEPERALASLREASRHAEVAFALAPASGDARFMRGLALDMQSQVLAHLGREAEARERRAEAVRAYRDVQPGTRAWEPVRQRLRELGASP